MMKVSPGIRRLLIWQIRSISHSGFKSLLLSACDNFSSADYKVNRFTRDSIIPRMLSRRKPQFGKRKIGHLFSHVKIHRRIEETYAQECVAKVPVKTHRHCLLCKEICTQISEKLTLLFLGDHTPEVHTVHASVNSIQDIYSTRTWTSYISFYKIL